MAQLISYLGGPPPNERRTWVAVTGHMVDRPDRETPRFPPESVAGVREELIHCLELQEREHGPLRVITSATQGVDLIAIGYCLERGWPAEIYLPVGEDAFLARAVNYGPAAAAWLAIYHQAKASTTTTIHQPVHASDPTRSFLAPLAGDKQHYVDLNRHIAGLLRPGDVLLAYWDGRGGDAPTGTEHMVRTALSAGIRCAILQKHLLDALTRNDTLSPPAQ